MSPPQRRFCKVLRPSYLRCETDSPVLPLVPMTFPLKSILLASSVAFAALKQECRRAVTWEARCDRHTSARCVFDPEFSSTLYICSFMSIHNTIYILSMYHAPSINSSNVRFATWQ